MNYKHLPFIEQKLKSKIQKLGTVKADNNLNSYLDFQDAETYINQLKKEGSDRIAKSSKDVLLGRLVEEIIIYLFKFYFLEHKLNYLVSNDKQDENLKALFESFKIVHRRLGYEKKFDIDIIITNKAKSVSKCFAISSKGTSRERIGQYLSHLYLMDDRVIKMKYKRRYFLDFHEKNITLRYGLVCMDWAKAKDFVKYTSKNKLRKTLKETEVQLINDDYYIGGGVTVLNNLQNLDGVMRFSELAGKIVAFLN